MTIFSVISECKFTPSSFMEKSIQYFNEVCIQRFVEMKIELYQNPKNLAEYIQNLEKELRKLGRNIISETLEDMNQALIYSEHRKNDG